MLTPYLPYPPSSGGQVRSYNLLKHLGKKYQIVLVALIKDEGEKQFVENLREYCEKIYVCKRPETPWLAKIMIKSIFGLYPFLVVRNFSLEAKEVVRQLLQENHFDLIHAETFYIMPHIPKTNIPILLVEQTIEYQVYQHFTRSLKNFFLKPFFYFDILKLKFWEKTYWQQANLVVAVSEMDKKKMLEVLPNLKVKIIPNGAGEDLMNIFDEKKEMRPIFLYQGNFSWLQNVEAAKILAKQIFPKIKKKIPQAICYIAGQQANEKIGYLKRKGIHILDIEPSQTEKVKQIYQDASIFLAPIEGPGGTRLKILGAMAAGLPVISSQTGIDGLEVTHGNNVLIARNPEEFVHHAITISNDVQFFERIRKNARNLVSKKYNWTNIAKSLEDVYLQMTKYHL